MIDIALGKALVPVPVKAVECKECKDCFFYDIDAVIYKESNQYTDICRHVGCSPNVGDYISVIFKLVDYPQEEKNELLYKL